MLNEISYIHICSACVFGLSGDLLIVTSYKRETQQNYNTAVPILSPQAHVESTQLAEIVQLMIYILSHL